MNTATDTVCFPVKQTRSFDVVVVGGGTTGVTAALAAARTGAHTAIVENHGFLGGNAATGLSWLGFHSREGEQVVGGIAAEFIDRMRSRGGATEFYIDPIVGSVVGVNPHWWKLIASESMREAGIETFLQSLAVDVETSHGGQEGSSGAMPRAEAVLIQGRGGVIRLTGKVIIDCTDSGAAAGYAGVRLVRGRQRDARVQVASWTFQIGGVDFAPMLDYFDHHPDQLRPFNLPEEKLRALLRQMVTADVFVMGAFKDLIARARAEGLALPRENLPGVGHRRDGVMTIVATRVEDVDPTAVENFSAAEMEGARQTMLWIRFLRRYVPGCKEIQLIGTPHQIGIRESNHMEGDYLLTAEDLLESRNFDDRIALGAYHLDIHSPDHTGIESRFSPVYQIPYRSLIPAGIEGMLVAGRAISATHEAMASTRVIPICMAQGQAAGAAAAMAAAADGQVRDVPVEPLQKRLRNNGAILECRQSRADTSCRE